MYFLYICTRWKSEKQHFFAVFNPPKKHFSLLSETSFWRHILKHFSAICHHDRAFGMGPESQSRSVDSENHLGKWRRTSSSWVTKHWKLRVLAKIRAVQPQFWNSRIEVVRCYHLMMIVNQIWPTSGTTTILDSQPQFWKSAEASEKRSPWTPKKWKWEPKKKVFLRIHLGKAFLQKTRSKMVKFGLCNPISDLQTPIGGSHPVLYFTSQITEKYSTAMYYSKYQEVSRSI